MLVYYSIRLDGCLDMSRMLGGRVYMFVQSGPDSNYSLLLLTRYYYYIIMGYKSTYQELVYKQPPSFSKRGEYKIQYFQKPLGRGSSGKVVSAKWIVGGVEKDVALKCVPSSSLPPLLLLSSSSLPPLPLFLSSYPHSLFTLTYTNTCADA